MEALNLLIEDWNRETGELVAKRTKVKYNRWSKEAYRFHVMLLLRQIQI